MYWLLAACLAVSLAGTALSWLCWRRLGRKKGPEPPPGEPEAGADHMTEAIWSLMRYSVDSGEKEET